jgi:Transposase IS66 family
MGEGFLGWVSRCRVEDSRSIAMSAKIARPFDNNHAERSIRPAVIIRKNSYGNRSEQGSDCRATLMSIFRTLKQRGHDPIRTIIHARLLEIR